MLAGLRVVRIGEWQFGVQDGGELHAGTISLPDRLANATFPKHIAFIAWDNGTVANYCSDVLSFDLRVFDNAQTGARHVFVTCDVCGHSGIIGFRWHCTECHDYDLCSECYMGDKHNLEHTFVRFDTPTSIGVEVPPREKSSKKDVYGIFPGSRVVRGIDWKWGNQDGGVGSQGLVCEVHGRDESWRSVVDVRWDTGNVNRYRLGLEGKVDIQTDEPVIGGQYYCDHLPQLSQYANSPLDLRVGDRVKVDVTAETLEALQKERDDWSDEMAQLVGKSGNVVCVRRDVDVAVYFSFCKKMFHFYYKALVKVPKAKQGDIVLINSSKELVEQLQADHGGWVASMKAVLGRQGTVTRIFDSGDLRVSVGGRGTWTLNPECCTIVSHSSTLESPPSSSSSSCSSDDEDESGQEEISASSAGGLSSLGTQLLRQLFEREKEKTKEVKVFDPENLVHLADRGDAKAVVQLIANHPEKVNELTDGRLPLHVAAAKGHEEIIKLLLAAGADINAVDSDGDIVLHYAVYGDKAEIMKDLIQRGANINASNKKGRSSLQIAVCKPSRNCIAVLLQHDSININHQDSDGDTALHDAIYRGSDEIVDLILTCPNIDFNIVNRKTFNVLHQAAFKGNVHALEQLLKRPHCQQLINVGTSDEQTPLHIAAVNGYREVAQAIVDKGKANVDASNVHKHTPLMLAMSEGRASVIEFLVSRGADVNLADKMGVTCLHTALSDHTTVDLGNMPRVKKSTPREFDQAPAIAKICLDLPSSLADRQWIAIACFLVEHGAKLDRVDSRGNTPVSHVKNPAVVEILQKYARTVTVKECMMCADTDAAVTFEPCGHRIVCVDCSVRMKKCFLCHEPIVNKLYNRTGVADVKSMSDIDQATAATAATAQRPQPVRQLSSSSSESARQPQTVRPRPLNSSQSQSRKSSGKTSDDKCQLS